MEKKIAVYPGTFDPITLGHLDVIRASANFFDKVIIGILINPAKKPKFSDKKRFEMIRTTIKQEVLSNVSVIKFQGLTVEFAIQEKAIAIIRGLRLVMDYESELDMSFNNRILSKGIQTVFIAPSQEHIHIRSSTVRELLSFGVEDLRRYVPWYLVQKLK